jgi:hypothetical protein
MTQKIRQLWNHPMNRRQALRTTGGLLAAGAVGLGLPFSARGRTTVPPNIIFILTDDHRWDALSILGHPVVETPSLDRLCGEGVRFENAFVTTSLCSPSRASFLTGQYAGTHGVKNNLTPWSNDNVTFLERLKTAGYDTSFIGKWHMPGDLPHLRGVDQFITFTEQGGQGRYFDCPLIVDGVETPSRKHYITEELTDYALEFIERKRDKPFCLYLSHKAVHHQFLPPPHIAGIYKDKKLPLPPEADTWISWNVDHLYCGLIGPLERTYRNYLETLHATDIEIGRILAQVYELGLSDNTIIIYFGDNGFFFGEHRFMDKRWAYEESIRVPCIFRVFTPVIIYVIACPRGASLAERVVASMMPLFGWAAYQLYLAAGVFSIGETIYYGFSSAFLFAFCVLISVIGLCELVFRLTVKQHHLTKNRVLGPIIAILMGPLSVFVLMIWGGGVHFFYVYQEGYKLLFH